MGMILWTLQEREHEQQQEALYRDSAWARQKIRLGLARRQEYISSLSRNIANAPPNHQIYRAVAQNILHSYSEITEVPWIDNAHYVYWQLPTDLPLTSHFHTANTKLLDQAILDAIDSARINKKPVYSRPLRNDQQEYFFYYATPVLNRGKTLGVIGTLYSANRTLNKLIPFELTEDYKFTLQTRSGTVLANTSFRPLPNGMTSYATTLDAPWDTLILRATSYPPVSNLVHQMLMALVISLSCFLLWCLWRLWHQNQERQIAQQNLTTETAFRRAMENSIVLGMRALDMEGRITYVNPAFCQMTGWSESDLLGKTAPFAYWPHMDMEKLKHYLTLTLQGNAPASGFQGRMQRKDGSIFFAHMYISPLINQHGKQTGWISSMTDITESKRAREELAMAHARFTTLLESLDASVSVLSPANAELLFANHYYRQLFNGQARGHLELSDNKFDLSLIDDDSCSFLEEDPDLPASEQVRAASVARGMYLRMRNTSAACEVYLPDLRKWFDVRQRYVQWVDGHLAHVVIATDISARKQAEEMAHRHEEELQFASRLTTMGEMASSLAHELNQPLGAITNYCMGAVTRLRSGNTRPEDLLSTLEKTSAQAVRASTIISRIRGFVKRSVPQQRQVDIRDVIADAVGLAEITAIRQSIRIVTDIPIHLPLIWLDPLLIEQVLVNLLKNAAESMFDSKTPHTTRLVKLQVSTSDELLSPGLLLRVIDQGPGIDEANREQMFEPFYSTKPDGIGMGLNICRSIVESHHGRLWVENNANGKGCTFAVLLPLQTLNGTN
ncbi:MAG: PAS domain S-box protein [Ottowia sp.]|nr:PAS domain S-box protein [Ottowia sp.]